MEDRTVGTLSASGNSSTTLESKCTCASSHPSMDITNNLVSRLNTRLEVLDLYTTEMFQDELFLARRYMVPWRFRRNEKISKRWKLLHQQLMCEEMLVEIKEPNLNQSQNVSRIMLELETTSSDLIESDTSTPDPGPSYRVVGKGKLYNSRYKKGKSKPADGDSPAEDKSHIAGDVNVADSDVHTSCDPDKGQRDRVKGDKVKGDDPSEESDGSIQSSNDQIESAHGEGSQKDGYNYTAIKSASSKIPSSANVSSDSGFEEYKVRRHAKKTARPLSSSILKRIEEMSRIYDAGKNISEMVRMKTLQRLHELKVKVEITEKSNKTIFALRDPNAAHQVSKF